MVGGERRRVTGVRLGLFGEGGGERGVYSDRDTRDRRNLRLRSDPGEITTPWAKERLVGDVLVILLFCLAIGRPIVSRSCLNRL